MFGFGAIGKYRLAQQLHKTQTPIAITQKEMKAKFIESGMTEKEAKFQLGIQKIIGSGGTCLIGDKMYTLKQRKTPKKKS